MFRFLRSIHLLRPHPAQDANAGDNSLVIQSGGNTYVNSRQPRDTNDFDVFFVNAPDSNEIIYMLPFGRKKSFLVPFVLGILNKTPYTIEHTELIIDMPHYLYRKDMFNRVSSDITSARGVKVAIDPIEGTQRHLIYINIPAIPPQRVAGIQNAFYFDNPTNIDTTLKTKTKDDFGFGFNLQLSCAWVIKIQLNVRDTNTISKTVNIRSLMANKNMEVRQIRRDKKIKTDYTERRAYVYFKRFSGFAEIETARCSLRTLYKQGGESRVHALSTFARANSIQHLPQHEQEKRLFSYLQERCFYAEQEQTIC